MKSKIHRNARKVRGCVPFIPSYCIPANETFRAMQASLKPLERVNARALQFGAAK